MNRELKEIRELGRQRKYREERGLLLAEGLRITEDLDPAVIRTAVFSNHFLTEGSEREKRLYEKLSALPSIRILRVSDEDFRRISDTVAPQGVLVVTEIPRYTAGDILQDPRKLIVILEGLQDPGNVGTVFRSGEAAGISGVILDRKSADPTSPKTVRATMCSFFRVPLAVSDDLPGLVREIRKKGGVSYAAHLAGSTDYAAEDYRPFTAFLIGNEANGLSDALTETADKRIRIPMQGRVESLNAAMAASVLLFEAARQRRG